MTESAAPLADLARWVGMAIAFVGALLANPAATDHGLQATRRTTRAVGRRARGLLARLIPPLRRDDSRHRVSASRDVVFTTDAVVVTRGLAGWGPDTTADEKFEILDARTRAHDQGIADLHTLVDTARRDLGTQLSDAVNRLTADTAVLRAHVNALQQESVRSGATALPLVVVGVVLADLSSDAARFQVWAWVLLLALAVVLAGWSAGRVLRAWPRRS